MLGFPTFGLRRRHERLQSLAISNSNRRFRCELETSVGDHSSVDREGCADDVGCLVRGNEHDGICNFFGSADALVRNLCVEEICFVFLGLRKVVEHSRFHRTWANDVDPNACAGEFESRRLRDAFHSVLAAAPIRSFVAPVPNSQMVPRSGIWQYRIATLCSAYEAISGLVYRLRKFSPPLRLECIKFLHLIGVQIFRSAIAKVGLQLHRLLELLQLAHGFVRFQRLCLFVPLCN
jgi:hypothetical protein